MPCNLDICYMHAIMIHNYPVRVLTDAACIKFDSREKPGFQEIGEE